jgi:hypothetical protein
MKWGYDSKITFKEAVNEKELGVFSVFICPLGLLWDKWGQGD